MPERASEDVFADWLASYASSIDRPIVLPTSDRYVLWLARHRERLSGACRLWSTAGDVVEALVSKDRFHSLLESAALRSPPSIVEPAEDDLRRWCECNPAPYLIKPFYESALTNSLGAKNKVAATAAELFERLDEPAGFRGLIVQRMLRGGDGWHYTVAGLSDRDGRLRALVTKRKLVQYPPDTGIVVHARLPSCDGAEEDALLDATRRLLSAVPYHGLFGVEWLKERSTGVLYALDFNPRSLNGNSHLDAAGVNLPYLAYRDLCGADLSDVPERAAVETMVWSDAWGCLGAWSRSRGTGRFTFEAMLEALLETDAWSAWSHRDPAPSLAHDAMQIGNLLRSLAGRAPRLSPAARG
jgi:predicted ATP-grasp superfamily ATP-dependent carboligase